YRVSGYLNLAVSFKARLMMKFYRVASATTELIHFFQSSLTRRKFLFFLYRALKDTAKFILSLRDDLCTGFK
ncbi:MAG: hypothetical protein M3Q78_01485, partial [Acidobacteriota bacterium]|nr:hypothetical protein [Acidobacteriota bacterium]